MTHDERPVGRKPIRVQRGQFGIVEKGRSKPTRGTSIRARRALGHEGPVIGGIQTRVLGGIKREHGARIRK